MKAKLFSILAVSTLALTPVLASADVTIVNSTDADASVEVVHFPMCSGPNPMGVISKKSSKVLPTSMVNRVCRDHEKDCVGLIYMTDDCSGAAVGKVTLNLVAKTITTENYNVDGYRVSVSGDTITIDKPSFLQRLFS